MVGEKADSIPESAGAFKIITILIITGIAGIAFYAIQQWSLTSFTKIFAIGILTSGAALLIGGLLGFLFGIPRTNQQNQENEKGPNNTIRTEKIEQYNYEANTNLEQISDWLTKILVGVGLTQLTQIPSLLISTGEIISMGIGNPEGGLTFGITIIPYYLVCGFLFGYLWTRIYLARVLRKADIIANQQKARAAAYIQKAEKEKEIPYKNRITGINQRRKFFNIVSSLTANEIAKNIKSSYILWVDDHPDNNRFEINSFEELGINVDSSLSTDDAIKKLNHNEYDVIISDMKRGSDEKAGFALMKKLKELKIDIPLIIYAGASLPNEKVAAEEGVYYVTDDPKELFLTVVRLVKK